MPPGSSACGARPPTAAAPRRRTSRCCARSPRSSAPSRPTTAPLGRSGAGSDQGAVTRTAAWINIMLHTERATRGQQRAFVRYGDLLEDWTQPVFALGEAFDLAAVKTAMAVDIAEVHRFIDPSLRRVTMTWDDIDVPTRLRELADETWQALDSWPTGRRRLGRPPGAVRPAAGRLRRATTPRPRRSRRSTVAGRAPRGQPRGPLRPGRRAGPGGADPRPPRGPGPGAARPPGAGSARPSAGSGRRCPGLHRPTSPASRGTPTTTSAGPGTPRTAAGARADLRLPGQERGPQPAVGAAADVRGRPARRARRQRLRRRHRGRRPARSPSQHGAADRLTLARYPFRVSRAGAEHLTTPPDSVHSLTHFYNWSFSHVRTSYSMKWDGDMVLTREGVELLARPVAGSSRTSAAIVAMPRHPLSVVDDSTGLARPRPAVPRALGLPDGPGVHVRQGLRVGAARVPGHAPSGSSPQRAVRRAEVARRRRVRALADRRSTSPDARLYRASCASSRSTGAPRGPGRRASAGCTGSRRRPACTSSTT